MPQKPRATFSSAISSVILAATVRSRAKRALRCAGRSLMMSPTAIVSATGCEGFFVFLDGACAKAGMLLQTNENDRSAERRIRCGGMAERIIPQLPTFINPLSAAIRVYPYFLLSFQFDLHAP